MPAPLGIVTDPRVAEQLKARGESPLFEPTPVQWEMISREEFEVLTGGARGGGKTAAGIYWLLRGNLTWPDPRNPRPADLTYVNHPGYRALVLRKNQSDLEDWVRKAHTMYIEMGASLQARSPVQFVWPHPTDSRLPGATIVIGHLADSDAYEKYQGQEFQRLLLEETTQIPSYDLYAKVLASIRSVYPELKPQIFLTANPGGPGHGWVKDRFISVQQKDGTMAPPKTTIRWEWDKDRKLWVDLEKMGTTRVFIPALASDNKVMMEKDPLYVERLMSTLSPALRRAWIFGDWDAMGGRFFEEFRPTGPLPGEPANANHVIEPVDMRSWWFRWAACDWGYSHEAALLVACQHPNGQIHVYKELVGRQHTPTEWGALCARTLLPELENLSGNVMTIWLSHDAFQQRTDERTYADQMAEGIKYVLGPDSVYIPDLEGKGSPFARRELQNTARIAIRRASRHRSSGWQYLRQLMRWDPPLVSEGKFDPEYALTLVNDSGNLEAYHKYLKIFEKEQSQVLPKLQIWKTCPRLIDAIPKLVCADPMKGGDPEDASKTHFEGSDVDESLRYLTMAHHEYTHTTEPFEQFFERRMADLAPADGNARIWAARKAERDYAEMSSGSSIHLAGSRRRQVQ